MYDLTCHNISQQLLLFVNTTKEKLNVVKIKGDTKLIKVVKVEKNLFYEDIWHAHQALLENHESSLQWIYGLQ